MQGKSGCMLSNPLIDMKPIWFYSKCWGLKGFAFPLRVTPHSVGRCHVVTEGTAAVSEGGGAVRRMRWGALINTKFISHRLTHLHLISHFVTASPRGEAKKTPTFEREPENKAFAEPVCF